MYRINIPVPPDEDFPEVVVAQRMGEGFEKEYVEYGPRWRSDKVRRTVVVDEKCFYAMADTSERLKAENAKLRELMCSLHRAYVGALNECESLNEGLIWEYSGNIDADVAKSKARFEADRHRFDVAMNELGVEVDG